MENGVSRDIQKLTQEEDTTTQTEELLKKNLELTEEIHKMTKKIKGYLAFQKLMTIFYFFIIVVPIILSIIYLPPLLKGIAEPYLNLLSDDKGNINLENLKIEDLSPEVRSLLE